MSVCVLTSYDIICTLTLPREGKSTTSAVYELASLLYNMTNRQFKGRVLKQKCVSLICVVLYIIHVRRY